MKELRDHSCEACDEALRQLQKHVATTEGIDRARALMDLGMAALIGWRLDLALASFGASLGLLPPDEFLDLEREALYKESCVLAEMGRYDEAIERVSRAKALAGRLGRRRDALEREPDRGPAARNGRHSSTTDLPRQRMADVYLQAFGQEHRQWLRSGKRSPAAPTPTSRSSVFRASIN